MLEIWYIAMSGDPLSSCSNEGPRVQDGSMPGSPVRTIEMNRNLFKNLLLQNHPAQMLEVWYVALPSGLLPS